MLVRACVCERVLVCMYDEVVGVDVDVEAEVGIGVGIVPELAPR